ncbi:MAG: two-component system NtrC family sensor kinase [Kiritimatiellia bacterium]|jgi:two-component system NtrC family sensor kinase
MRPGSPHWNFSRKILVPILLIMAALVASTTLFMNYRFRELIREQASLDLINSQRMFSQYMEVRLNDFQHLANSIPTDNRVRAAALYTDTQTLAGLLQEILLEKNVSGIAYTNPDGESLLVRGHSLMSDIPGISKHMESFYEGNDASWLGAINDTLFEFAASPVFIGPQFAGVVVIMQAVDELAAFKLSHLTGCEVAFWVNDTLAVSTWRDRRQRKAFAEYFQHSREKSPLTYTAESVPDARKFSMENEHFLYIHQTIEAPETRISAMLVSSYESQLHYLSRTRSILIAIGILGICLGGSIAGLVIRRATAPLKSLQENVEAVGRGEFDRKVPADSADEIGQLANSFNQMTENLDQSKRELETTRDRLVQSEKLSALGEFIAGVAHELNNPLTVMVGYSQLLAESDLDEEVQEDLKQIADSAERCQGVVKNLLSFARQRPPERLRMDINELLEGTIRFMHYELRTSGVQIERQLADGLSAVMGDAHQLQQVFLNLARNAQQAMEGNGKSGTLQVLTSNLADRSIEIRVKDSGPGIPLQVIDKIFDPFFTSKGAGKGTGLGLSVSYGIIQEHGGHIHAESPPGEGATFVIHLPAIPVDALSAAAPTSVRQPPTFGHLQRMLVVDDEPGILHMVKEILKPFGFEIDLAQEAQEGLRLLSQRPYDVILSDWKMPEMSGQDFFETWKSRSVGNPDAARFIFMTGDVLNTDMLAYLELHGAAYLEKPFGTAELTDLLERVCTVEA